MDTNGNTCKAMGKWMTELFFLPYAGGSAMSFAPYEQYLDSAIRTHYIDLPGHGKRIGEPFVSDMFEAIDFVCDEIKRKGQGDHYAIFGHSMGNLLAFEAYHQLRRDGYVEPVYLFLSGRGVPNRYLDVRKVSTYDDESFLAEVEKFGGLPSELLRDRTFREYIIPSLRSDFGIIENYKGNAAPRTAVSCPVTVLCGRDDLSAPPRLMSEWSKECKGDIMFLELPGDHFFCLEKDNIRLIAKRINHDLEISSRGVRCLM